MNRVIADEKTRARNGKHFENGQKAPWPDLRIDSDTVDPPTDPRAGCEFKVINQLWLAWCWKYLAWPFGFPYKCRNRSQPPFFTSM